MIENIQQGFAGKRVLLTGHTGFKGGWAAVWLNKLGASVYGLSLAPETSESFFDVCNVESVVDHYIGDIRDYKTVKDRIVSVKPDVVIHMAAQSLVRRSYLEPLMTLETNVMGTANILQAINESCRDCRVLIISSDKCYENIGEGWGFRETDPMGGADPYSMSKGAVELLTSSWRTSFFGADSAIKVGSARAGNVIGGGDWSEDRIIPDCIRSFTGGPAVELRNPNSTRPWQHVLEPLGGYFFLLSKLMGNDPNQYCEGWNFGPVSRDVRPVKDVVNILGKYWGDGAEWSHSEGEHPYEAAQLSLNCEKSFSKLSWEPTWSLDTGLQLTADWYKAWHLGDVGMYEFTVSQIEQFEKDTQGNQLMS